MPAPTVASTRKDRAHMTGTKPTQPARPKLVDRIAARNRELAPVREKRFTERQARILADPTLSPGLKAAYLNRTILNTTDQSKRIGWVGTQRLSMMRTGRRKPDARPGRHPSAYLEPDTIVAIVAGVEDEGVEQGRVDEWTVETGRNVWDESTQTFVKAPSSRHGLAPTQTDTAQQRRAA